MSLLDRISARTVDRPAESRYAIDQYIADYLLPAQFGFGGAQYSTGGLGLTQTLAGNRATEFTNTLPGYLRALRACPPAFSAQLVRALVLSQARFVFRNPPWHPSTPRRTFGNRDLQLLEHPWPNATTGELITRMEWHAGLTGNAFVVRRPATPASPYGRLRVLRPDWTAILYGSDREPDDPGHALDGELLGYVYQNQGLFSSQYKPEILLPGDVAHWSPIPDPESAGIGMSWITPAIREIQKDRLATQHTIKYFEQGATPNLVVKGITAANSTQFKEIVEMMEAGHAGIANAYKTLYLTSGADATVVGSNLAEVDLKAVNGSAETRIASLSRVHPVILGIAEGLAGSSLNAGNFGMARRIWADSWIYPTLQDLAASLAPLINVPADAELWTDTGDMPILREDAKDAADIEQVKASTIVSLVNGGFTADSVLAAVNGQNMGLLKHSGMVSVQLQQPGAETSPPGGGAGPKAPAPDSRSADDDLTEDEHALLVALLEFEAEAATRSFDPSKHARNPKGSAGGGRFRSMVDRIKDAVEAHAKSGGDGDPFEGFSREQLRRVAKAKGLELPRGASRELIAERLLDHHGVKGASEVHGEPEVDDRLVKAGHAVFEETRPATSVDQIIDAFRRQRAADPDVSTDDLIAAADEAAAAFHPKLKDFHSKHLGSRRAEIDAPAKTPPKGQSKPKAAGPPKASSVTPKPAPDPQDYPKLTAREAQQMQDALPPPWSGAERNALRYYTGNSAVPNGLLRGWIEPPGQNETQRKKIEAAHKQIEAARSAMRPSDRPMLVRRTAGPEQFNVATTKELDHLVGHTFIEHAFLSTTTKANAGVGGKVKMDIEVPSGTPLAFVKSVSKYPYEDEILLAPGLKYTIISVTGPPGRPTVRVRVEAVA